MKRPHLLTDDQVATATRLWADGASLNDLCASLGINRDTLAERRRPGDQLAHLGRRPRGARRPSPRFGDPTPGQIRERASAIRATWSERERLNRLAAPGQPVDSFTGERHGREASTRRPMPRKW